MTTEFKFKIGRKGRYRQSKPKIKIPLKILTDIQFEASKVQQPQPASENENGKTCNPIFLHYLGKQTARGTGKKICKLVIRKIKEVKKNDSSYSLKQITKFSCRMKAVGNMPIKSFFLASKFLSIKNFSVQT